MTQIKDLTIIKTAAAAGDWLVLQAATGETYRIKKSDLIIDNINLATLPEVLELVETDFVIVQTSSGTARINKDSVTLKPWLKWSLSETSGTTAIDSSVNGRNGTYSNCSPSADGTVLSGTNGLIYVNTSTVQLSPVTIKLDFKTTSTVASGLWEFRSTQNISGTDFTPALRMSNTGKLLVYGYPSGTGFTTNSYNDGNWHTALAVIDANRIRLFVDKTKIIDVAAVALQSFTGFYSVGYSKGGGYGFFNGTVKNFQIWNQTLTDIQGVKLS